MCLEVENTLWKRSNRFHKYKLAESERLKVQFEKDGGR